MIWNRSNRFLRSEANDVGEGGGAAPVTTGAAAVAEAPEGGEPTAGAKAEPEAKKPGLLDQVLGSIQTKGSLVAELTGVRGELEAERGISAGLRTEIADLKGQVAAQSAELDSLRAERAEIAKALETAGKEKVSTEEAAAGIVAGLGVPAESLPAAQTEEESEDGLRARLEACTDPTERFRLAAKLREVRWGRN